MDARGKESSQAEVSCPNPDDPNKSHFYDLRISCLKD